MFLDIIDPITFGLNKNNILRNNKNLSFHFHSQIFFEFESKPIFNFESLSQLNHFLSREQRLAKQYDDESISEALGLKMDEIKETLIIEDLYLHMNIETNEDEIRVFFNTNSLLFKYEIIG